MRRYAVIYIIDIDDGCVWLLVLGQYAPSASNTTALDRHKYCQNLIQVDGTAEYTTVLPNFCKTNAVGRWSVSLEARRSKVGHSSMHSASHDVRLVAYL